MSSMFARIDRPLRLPEEIANVLAQAIAEGRLKPGDRLPTEQALAGEFGVARTVVREAISQLRYDRVVDSRQGVGAFVAPPEARTAFRIGPACFAKRQELLKLLQLRTSIVSDAAALAARARSKEHVAQMQGFLSEMEESQSDEEHGPERRVAAEAALYKLIAEAAGNQYFVDVITMIDGQVLGQLRSVAIKNAKAAEWGEEVLAEHIRVVEAIEREDATEAAAATREHYEKAAERLARRADFADV